MAEFVAGAFLSAFLQALFDRLASDEVARLFHGKQEISKILDELNTTMISANYLLNDAEEKQIKDDNVRKWLDRLKDLIYQADDLVDIIDNKAFRHQLNSISISSRTSKLLRRFIPINFYDKFDSNVKHKGIEILSRLKIVLDQKDALGLRKGAHDKVPSQKPFAPLVEESSVYGRKSEKEEIVKLLFSNDGNDNKMLVIAIVGMGGIGKTTIAQLVYDDDRVANYFELKVWVTISEDFDVFKITKTIFEKVSLEQCNASDLFEVQQRLREALRGKRFLFILDDVWNENYHLWDALRSSFGSGLDESKIIVTTRNAAVASVMANDIKAYRLTDLSDEDCWQIFLRHAFKDCNDLDAHEDLLVIGREIVSKCRGLPLAIKSLGGLLRSERDLEKWKNILKSDAWDEFYKKEGNILPALWLSYRHLPTHLKRCFAYCSIFPKDHKLKKDEIILLWMAEGFLQTDNRAKRMEEVGQQYFDDLLSRSLLQRSSQDGSRILMHDLVHDLAMFVAGEFCSWVGGADDMCNLTSKTRHLLYRKGKCDWSKSKHLDNSKCLRTFIGLQSPGDYYSKHLVPYDFLFTTRSCLRVLSLDHSSIAELPDSVGNLIHLRYLDLSHTAIKELPNSVCSLYNLQTLLLSHCGRLTVLPNSMEKLINLRHLDVQGAPLKDMKMQIRKMKSLQSLNKLIVGDGNRGSKINELKEVQPIGGRFEISRIENVVDVVDAMDANLKDKKGLTYLSLLWRFNAGDDASSSERERDREVVSSLCPHTNLRELKIKFYRGTTFPDWVGSDSFTNVVSVRLRNCKSCRSLPSLGQLPSLKELIIDGFDSVVTIGDELCGNGPSSFRCLEKLSIENMLKWKEWSFGEGRVVFPHLSSLVLIDCPMMNIKDVPSGCSIFPSLVEVEVTGCPELDSLLDWVSHSKLHRLCLWECPKLLRWDLHKLSSLVDLNISSWEVASFPLEGLLLPTSITDLWILNSDNLVSLNGEAFRCLVSLMHLYISNCPKLSSLPREGMPSSLLCLRIIDCPMLKQRCERDKGEDWPTIAHIDDVSVS